MIHCHSAPCTGCEHNLSENKENKEKCFEYIKYRKGQIIRFDDTYHRLLFILSGNINVTTPDNKQYHCTQHNMILLARKLPYRLIFVEDTEIVILHFTTPLKICDMTKIEDIEDSVRKYRAQFMILPMHEQVVNFVKSIKGIQLDNIPCKHYHIAKNLESFILFRYYYDVEQVAQFFYIIHGEITFRSLVYTNFLRACSATDLAELCGYKWSNFRQHFKKQFGQSPYQWMLQQKSEIIRSKLLDKTIPIKVIVTDFGFADQSHLNVYCKRFFQATPLEIRNGRKRTSTPLQHTTTPISE